MEVDCGTENFVAISRVYLCEFLGVVECGQASVWL